MRKFSVIPLAFAAIVTACGQTSVCTNPEVLKTLQKIFEEREFGQFVKLPAGVTTVKKGTATFSSNDSRTNVTRCSAVITVDLLQVLKNFQGFSEEDIAKTKEQAFANGQKTDVDNLIQYTVQTVRSGEHFVTIVQ